MATKADLIIAQRLGATSLPDNAQYQHRMEVRSASSDNVYVVAQRKSNGAWSCGCPGFISRRACKHATAMFPPLLAAYGGAPAQLGAKSEEPKRTPTPAAVERARKVWKGETHRKYNPAAEGFGSVDQWIAAAEAAAHGRGAFRGARGASAKAVGDLDWFGLTSLPADVGGLKRAFRKAALRYHPDQGGNAVEFKAMVAAYERLLKGY